jgi:hypothetical protein
VRKVYLTDLAEVSAYMRENGMDAHPLDSDALPDMREAHVVVIGLPGKAKAEADRLRARGVPDFRLSYVENQNLDDLGHGLRNPKHLRWDEVGPLREAPRDEELVTYPSGLQCLDGGNINFRWRIPSLVVMAGAYGSGKSTVAQFLAASFANGAGREIGSGALLCSWEDLASEVRRNVTAFGGTGEKTDLLDLVHYVRLDPTEDRLIEWYTGLVEYHMRRYGTRFFVLDPWNEVDHVKGGRDNETEYVMAVMRSLRKLVNRLNIILMILTHVPAKYIKGNGEIEPFKIGHSFGSSNFGNKADHGFCIVRTKKYDKLAGHTILRLDKSKIERRMGRRGTLALKFNEEKFKFTLDDMVTIDVQDIWKD